MSIRRQFVFALSTFAVLLAVLFGWVSRRVSVQALENELDRRLLWVGGAAIATNAMPAELADLLPGDEAGRSWGAAHAKLDSLRSRYVSGAWVFNGVDKKALVTAEPADSTPIGTALTFLDPWDSAIRIALRDGTATTDVFPDTAGRLYKYGFIRLEDPRAMLAVLMPADFLTPLSRLNQSLVWGSVLALVLAVGLGTLLATGIARPVEQLSRAAIRIQRGRLDRPVELRRGDELGRLAQAMERMRKGVVERDEQLRLMLAQVAHEIRNPLGGLELFAAAAAETEDAEERGRHMGRVRAEVAALNRIIDDFLTFARPLRAEPEPIDVREAIDEAAALVCGELERRGGRLEVVLPDQPLMARADPDQVKRAVLNLLRNAAQVSERVFVSASAERGEVLVRVADDGPGVPIEERARIFEPFVSDKEQGAGLGLAIVRKVAEAHGGRVEVHSAAEAGVGTGAEFRVYLTGMEDFSPA
jgi:signal transduction histidine kinase